MIVRDPAIDAGLASRPPWFDRDWLAVAAAVVGQFLSVGTLTVHIFGVFVHPFQAEFGWTRTELSFAVSITQYTLGVTTPLWGFMSDRLGPRALLLPTTVALSGLVAALSLLTPPLWHFYLMFLLIPLLAPSPVLYSMVLACSNDASAWRLDLPWWASGWDRRSCRRSRKR